MTDSTHELRATDGAVFAYSPLRLLIMQSTSFCNINCSYCYLPERHVAKRMSLETVDAIFSDLLTAPFVGKRFTAVWHAGEPLTIGLPFYRYALDSAARLARRDCKVTHSIQTNATLIDDEWCEFFRHPDIRIGVSIDGPAFLHDRNRKDRLGQSTHTRVVDGIKRLSQHQIDFHAICVLTRHSLDYPDEIFHFFQALGVKRLCFNIDEIEGINSGSSMNAPEALPLFRQFLCRFYELAADNSMQIREFDSLRSLIHSGHYDHTSTQSLPFSIISVATDGRFSSFSPELLAMHHPRYKNFIFGNVHQQALASMLDSHHFRWIYGEIKAGVNRCRDNCQYFALCGGGAPSNKVFENGTFDSTETVFCRFSKQAVIDVVLSKTEEELGIAEAIVTV